MLKRKIMLGVAVCLVGALLVSMALAQAGPAGPAGGRQDRAGARADRGGPGGMRFDPERMRQMMDQRMREQLGATEEEWKVLGPRVTKVSELRRQMSGFGRGGMFGGGRRGQQADRPGARQETPERELSLVEKATEQLRAALENTSTKPEDVKKLLTALRAAKEKTRQQLATAQADLRKVVTVRQEAQLVLMSMLD